MAVWWSQRTLNQRIGVMFGAVYVLVGAVGFAVTTGVGFAASQGKDLLFLELNPLHNVVHLAVGTALIAAAARAGISRGVNVSVGAVYLAVGVAGSFLAGGGSAHPAAGAFPSLLGGGNAANILALNHPDNALHFLSAAVLVVVALWPTLRPGARSFRDGFAGQAKPVDTQNAQEQAAERRPRTPAGVAAGDVPGAGVYRCSCNDFAVFVRDGVELPGCPVGVDHSYRVVRRTKASTARTTRSA